MSLAIDTIGYLVEGQMFILVETIELNYRRVRLGLIEDHT